MNPRRGTADVPVDPDAPEAREWLREELGGGEQADPGELPGWLDDLLDWLRSLLDRATGQADAGDPTAGLIGAGIVVLVLVGLLIAAFLIWGLPRRRRRSRVTGDLFGEDDARGSGELRSVAERAAAAGDYTTASIEVYRALARALAERGIVHTYPGTTAQDFARRAAGPFPGEQRAFAEAADVFDRLRYLGETGTEEQWAAMSALDRRVRGARPRTRGAAEALEGVPR